MSLLDFIQGDVYLDLLGGKGLEAINIAIRHPHLKVYMMDANAQNIFDAINNAEVMNTMNIKFLLNDARQNKGGIPLSDNSVDMISILGASLVFMADEDIEQIFIEVFRVIKNKGIFFFDGSIRENDEKNKRYLELVHNITKKQNMFSMPLIDKGYKYTEDFDYAWFAFRLMKNKQDGGNRPASVDTLSNPLLFAKLQNKFTQGNSDLKTDGGKPDKPSLPFSFKARIKKIEPSPFLQGLIIRAITRLSDSLYIPPEYVASRLLGILQKNKFYVEHYLTDEFLDRFRETINSELTEIVNSDYTKLYSQLDTTFQYEKYPEVGGFVVDSFKNMQLGYFVSFGGGTGKRFKKLLDAIGFHGEKLNIDSSEEAVRKSKEIGIPASLQDVQNLKLEAGSVDAGIAAFLLEYIVELGKALAEINRVLRPGGKVVFLFHYPDSPIAQQASLGNKIFNEQIRLYSAIRNYILSGFSKKHKKRYEDVLNNILETTTNEDTHKIADNTKRLVKEIESPDENREEDVIQAREEYLTRLSDRISELSTIVLFNEILTRRISPLSLWVKRIEDADFTIEGEPKIFKKQGINIATGIVAIKKEKLSVQGNPDLRTDGGKVGRSLLSFALLPNLILAAEEFGRYVSQLIWIWVDDKTQNEKTIFNVDMLNIFAEYFEAIPYAIDIPREDIQVLNINIEELSSGVGLTAIKYELPEEINGVLKINKEKVFILKNPDTRLREQLTNARIYQDGGKSEKSVGYGNGITRRKFLERFTELTGLFVLGPKVFSLNWVASVQALESEKNNLLEIMLSQVSKDSIKNYMNGLVGLGERDAFSADQEQINNAAKYLLGRFEEMGIKAVFQEVMREGLFTATPTGTGNIIAVLPGDMVPDKFLIVSAHYDSKTGPGANDNASGVAVVLESARILSQYKLDYTIKFVLFTAEESMGMVGEKYFIAREENDNPGFRANFLGIINLDMVGNNVNKNEDNLPYEEDLDIVANFNIEGSRSLAGLVKETTRKYVPELRPRVHNYRKVFAGSSEMVFERRNYPALLLSEDTVEKVLAENQLLHTSSDNLENIDFDFLVNTAKAVVVSAASLAIYSIRNAFMQDKSVVDVQAADKDMPGFGVVENIILGAAVLFYRLINNRTKPQQTSRNAHLAENEQQNYDEDNGFDGGEDIVIQEMREINESNGGEEILNELVRVVDIKLSLEENIDNLRKEIREIKEVNRGIENIKGRKRAISKLNELLVAQKLIQWINAAQVDILYDALNAFISAYPKFKYNQTKLKALLYRVAYGLEEGLDFRKVVKEHRNGAVLAKWAMDKGLISRQEAVKAIAVFTVTSADSFIQRCLRLYDSPNPANKKLITEYQRDYAEFINKILDLRRSAYSAPLARLIGLSGKLKGRKLHYEIEDLLKAPLSKEERENRMLQLWEKNYLWIQAIYLYESAAVEILALSGRFIKENLPKNDKEFLRNLGIRNISGQSVIIKGNEKQYFKSLKKTVQRWHKIGDTFKKIPYNFEDAAVGIYKWLPSSERNKSILLIDVRTAALKEAIIKIGSLVYAARSIYAAYVKYQEDFDKLPKDAGVRNVDIYIKRLDGGKETEPSLILLSFIKVDEYSTIEETGAKLLEDKGFMCIVETLKGAFLARAPPNSVFIKEIHKFEKEYNLKILFIILAAAERKIVVTIDNEPAELSKLTIHEASSNISYKDGGNTEESLIEDGFAKLTIEIIIPQLIKDCLENKLNTEVIVGEIQSELQASNISAEVSSGENTIIIMTKYGERVFDLKTCEFLNDASKRSDAARRLPGVPLAQAESEQARISQRWESFKEINYTLQIESKLDALSLRIIRKLFGNKFAAYTDFIKQAGRIRAGPSEAVYESLIRNKGLFLNEAYLNNPQELTLTFIHEFGAYLGFPDWVNKYILENLFRPLLLTVAGKITEKVVLEGFFVSFLYRKSIGGFPGQLNRNLSDGGSIFGFGEFETIEEKKLKSKISDNINYIWGAVHDWEEEFPLYRMKDAFGIEPKDKVLVYPCGAGILSYVTLIKANQVYALDVNKTSILVSELRAAGIAPREIPVDEFIQPKDKESFDRIIKALVFMREKYKTNIPKNLSFIQADMLHLPFNTAEFDKTVIHDIEPIMHSVYEYLYFLDPIFIRKTGGKIIRLIHKVTQNRLKSTIEKYKLYLDSVELIEVVAEKAMNSSSYGGKKYILKGTVTDESKRKAVLDHYILKNIICRNKLAEMNNLFEPSRVEIKDSLQRLESLGFFINSNNEKEGSAGENKNRDLSKDGGVNVNDAKGNQGIFSYDMEDIIREIKRLGHKVEISEVNKAKNELARKNMELSKQNIKTASLLVSHGVEINAELLKYPIKIMAENMLLLEERGFKIYKIYQDNKEVLTSPQLKENLKLPDFIIALAVRQPQVLTSPNVPVNYALLKENKLDRHLHNAKILLSADLGEFVNTINKKGLQPLLRHKQVFYYSKEILKNLILFEEYGLPDTDFSDFKFITNKNLTREDIEAFLVDNYLNKLKIFQAVSNIIHYKQGISERAVKRLGILFQLRQGELSEIMNALRINSVSAADVRQFFGSPAGKNFAHVIEEYAGDALNDGGNEEKSIEKNLRELLNFTGFDWTVEGGLGNIQKIKIDKIIPEQLRVLNDNLEAVKDYMYLPVTLVKVADKYYLRNGHHRYVSALNSGLKELLAIVFVPEDEANIEKAKDCFKKLDKNTPDKIEEIYLVFYERLIVLLKLSPYMAEGLFHKRGVLFMVDELNKHYVSKDNYLKLELLLEEHDIKITNVLWRTRETNTKVAFVLETLGKATGSEQEKEEAPFKTLFREEFKFRNWARFEKFLNSKKGQSGRVGEGYHAYEHGIEVA
ncbi:MAG: M20/M25/M40 family metallo-hydrolase, partial [Candidatus Omnitrophica bacterium]|nr:M20/M25/M40 family metallo-hydrolase [Candidatus Omnitrophota bacterium]